jgi:hypothetical protein
MVKYLSEVHQTLGELIHIHQLNQELLETLSETMQWIRAYIEIHCISLPNNSAFDSLMNKAETLIEEITADTPLFPRRYRISDDSYHEPSNRRKVIRTFLILLVRNDDISSVPKEAYDDIWPIEYAELLVKKLQADHNAG